MGCDRSQGVCPFIGGLPMPCKCISFGLGARRLDKVKIEEVLQNIERPFCFATLHFNHFAGVCRLEWIGGKIADVAYEVKIFGEIL
jgi:hypothetical protein